MNIKLLFTIFITVFMAEMADKTQLATLLFASDRDINKWGVFMAAAVALVLSTAIAVLIGGAAGKFINKRLLSILAGCGFIIIGIITLIQGIRAS